jgi:hypothetical protein
MKFSSALSALENGKTVYCPAWGVGRFALRDLSFLLNLMQRGYISWEWQWEMD